MRRLLITFGSGMLAGMGAALLDFWMDTSAAHTNTLTHVGPLVAGGAMCGAAAALGLVRDRDSSSTPGESGQISTKEK